MRKKTKILFSTFSLFVVWAALFPVSAGAVCPICTVAVVGGLGLSRYLGVDDTISGIWIGGLILSSSLWLIDWLKKKSPKLLILNFKLLIIFVMYFLVLGPLAWKDIIGHPFNTIWGIDKLVIGTVMGSLAFLGGMGLDKKIRKIKGKQFFKYQKVVLPVVFLVIFSLLMYFVI